MNLNLAPGYMNIPGYYVIKNDKGEYLQIIKAGTYGRPQDGFGLCAEVRWTKRKALRAQWRSADAVNHQVVIMKLNDNGRAVFSSGWCVGLEAARVPHEQARRPLGLRETASPRAPSEGRLAFLLGGSGMAYEYDRRTADKHSTAVSFIETAISQLESVVKHIKGGQKDFNAPLGVRHAVETLQVAEKELGGAAPKQREVVVTMASMRSFGSKSGRGIPATVE